MMHLQMKKKYQRLLTSLLLLSTTTACHLGTNPATASLSAASANPAITACRSHLDGVIDGETVVGSGTTNLVVGFAGTALLGGGMVNYLFGPKPRSLAVTSGYNLEILNDAAPDSMATARTLADKYDATFVFPHKSEAQGSQWPEAKEGTDYFNRAVDYTDCLGTSFENVFTVGYSNGGQSAGTVALKAERIRGVIFAAGQSQFDASEYVGIPASSVGGIIEQMPIVFFYYEGDETITEGLGVFKDTYMPHATAAQLLGVQPRQHSGSFIWPYHLTPMGTSVNGSPVYTAMEKLMVDAGITPSPESPPSPSPGPAPDTCRCRRATGFPWAVTCDPGFAEDDAACVDQGVPWAE